MDTPIPGSGHGVKRGKRGETSFSAHSVYLGSCALGGGRWHMEGKTTGEWGEIPLFCAKSPKEREKSKQVINNMPTCTPEPKQPSELRHCGSPVPPTPPP